MQAGPILAAHGLRVGARDVGGTIGRKLSFFSHTGDVHMERLPNGSLPAGAAPGRRPEPEESA